MPTAPYRPSRARASMDVARGVGRCMSGDFKQYCASVSAGYRSLKTAAKERLDEEALLENNLLGLPRDEVVVGGSRQRNGLRLG
eukprot:40642-Pyramimonas_sp.AAC.1